MRYLILSLILASQGVFAEVQNFEKFNQWAQNLIRTSDGVWENGQKYFAISGKSIFGENCTLYITDKGVGEYYLSLTNGGRGYIGGFLASDLNVEFSMNDEFIRYKRDGYVEKGAIKIQLKDNNLVSAVAWSPNADPATCTF